MHSIEANGAKIPAIGLGTWTLRDEEAVRLVSHAVGAGYRHVDTAAMYENEAAVGEGIRASGLPRDEVFLTTKIWHMDLAEGDLQRSVEASLERLGFDAVDLALVHWPSKTIPLAETIKALDEVKSRGLARHIGLSNFTVQQIEQAVALSAHPIACNQVEYHPRLDQTPVLAACRKHGLALVSYCPLFRGGELFSEEPVAGLAAKYGKTPAQIVLRWHVQQEGVAAIPRSQRPERIEENLAVFDFALEDADMAAISALRSSNDRICDFDFSPVWDAA